MSETQDLMSVNLTLATNWTAPSLSLLNFTSQDCDEATAWAGASSEAFVTDWNKMSEIPLGLSIPYLRALLPNYWAPATETDLTLWYMQLVHNETFRNASNGYNFAMAYLLSYPMTDACGSMICLKLGWEGDPDVSGEGMIVSYYFAAGLSTIYFAVLIWSIVGRFGHVLLDHPKVERTVSCFKESINTFLDASLIFSVAMLGAAVVRFATIRTDPNEDHSAYATLGSVAMSSFSVLPAVILQTVTDGQRTHVLRQILWFAVIVMTVGLDIMYRKTYKDPSDIDPDDLRGQYPPSQIAWLNLCENEELRDRLRMAVTGTHALLAINTLWWVYYLLVTVLPLEVHTKMGETRIGTFFAHCRRWLRALDGIACMAMMWLLLSLFERYRHYVQLLAGRSDQDTEWTFGQVLALATWAPVLVEFWSILLYGPEKGLSRKLSSNYEVVAVTTSDGQEKGTPRDDRG
ncbi:hypothetical protein JX265_001626 [Neoarthrinium moseri]|uniref:Uncharacterized protein n=1 Tax=Neoarthrinium moseri TaxID=1658444 RepID=A0A9P9WVS0_9PEZI|nr:hypothetical protein JX265_001626 [Neoarthrinium moseri]